MSRNSSGSMTLATGNPVVTGTTISSATSNSTLSDIATEITNSLDRQGRGAMLAPLQLPNGSSSAPSLTFGSELGSGLYRAGTNDVRLQVGGATLEKWTDSGVTFPLAATVTGNLTLSGGLAVTGVTTLPAQTTIAAQSPGGLTGATGWTFTGGNKFARYWKDATGLVHVEAYGSFATGGGSNPFSSALPAGSRPFATLPILAVRSSAGGVLTTGTPVAMAVNTDGTFAIADMSDTDALYINATFYGYQ